MQVYYIKLELLHGLTLFMLVKKPQLLIASKMKTGQVPIVCEFTDVFLEEFIRLSLEWEVEFAIKLIPRSTPISITPCRMAPTELKE
ncbi:RVP_2 domain-containing protein [Gossypium australe]|uniref:RVP_2 domain-containing protein n=1 Tax=Gossypium australe TaxID=47621 RepID=A0A5B6WZY9_9ROSI|nr:RVP_2 domain-containing protein [Gossypium australe]